MVGIDENAYSDIALQWTLEELVDDGDEIICLRVIDKDSKIISDRNLERKRYQEEARQLMGAIQTKNDANRAISIVLEFAVGKVHSTFQKMIQIYEPAMLIVGTRGRSLGGFQGLVSNRNSFSKWCLQYSPIPVVVVRPIEKRLRKKEKRKGDPTRQTYVQMLQDSGTVVHEADSSPMNSAVDVNILPGNTPDVEAHAVAAALGLPARFDPTLKPIVLEGSHTLRKVQSGKSDVTTTSQGSLSPDSRPSSPGMVMKSPKSAQLDSPPMSGEEYSDEDEGDDEFEAVPGHTLLGNDVEQPELAKKQKLHQMEVGEAAALAAGRKASIGSVDSSGSAPGGAPVDEEDEDDE
jgi:nucleotide-binding universal stress UspA family protein